MVSCSVLNLWSKDDLSVTVHKIRSCHNYVCNTYYIITGLNPLLDIYPVQTCFNSAFVTVCNYPQLVLPVTREGISSFVADTYNSEIIFNRLLERLQRL